MRERCIEPRVLSPELPIHQVDDTTISGPAGDIAVRIYRPQGTGPFGVLVYFHGSWVISDLDTADSVCRQLATNQPCRRIGGYRLAPERISSSS